MADDVFGIVGTMQAGCFRVESVVAEGGFGVVYRAHHKDFRAPVALKCLKVPESMTPAQRAEFLDKFRAEGEVAFRLSSQIPAVVRPLQIGTLDGARFVPFLAMEWLDGEALDEIILKRSSEGKPPINIHKLVKLLAPVAQALDRAHKLPGKDGPVCIVHRDLKPENIFVSETPAGTVVKILDYGIAKMGAAAQQRAGRMTAKDIGVAFTPGYAAPEQWKPTHYGQTGPWTDVYSLAMTMVEALIGHAPCEGDAAEMMSMTLDPAKRPTPRQYGAQIALDVDAIFERALAVDPRARTQSIEAMWTPLERALGFTPTIAVEAERAPTIQLDSQAPLPPVPAAPGSQPRSHRIPALDTRGSAPAIDHAPAPRSALGKGEDRFEITLDVDHPPMARPVRQAQAYVDVRSKPKSSGGVPSNLKRALRTPLKLFFVGIAIAMADSIYGRIAGESLALGGIRPVFIAGPLALIGLMLAVFRVIFREED